MPADGQQIGEDAAFSLFVLIAQTKDAILKARQIEYERFGISNERRALLWIIQSYGGQATPAEIARRIFRELQSITEMLQRMEKDGLVERCKGTGRSKTVVKLSDKGREVLRQSLHNKADKNIFSVLSADEQDQLASSLSKVRTKAFEELGITDVELSVKYVPRAQAEGGAVR
jgi:DNA-binding MarR family transcriptional regulator